LQNFETGVEVMQHSRQLKLDYTLTTPGLLEIRNMVELSKKYNVELLTKVTFAFDPSILISPLALPRQLLDEIINESLTWLSANATGLQQSLIDVLTNLKSRPTFEEQWPDTFAESARRGKNWYKQLDQIRQGNTIEYILSKDKRLVEWWNNV
jgi:hypothetical protein